MTDNDITTICGKIESLHDKILKSNFSEMVTESEMICLILAVQELNRQKAEIEALIAGQGTLQKLIAETLKGFAEAVKMEFYREFDELIPSTMADKIDNLVKEMVGDDNG